MKDIHAKGQYFTKNKTLQQYVRELILNEPKCILEPSIGRGDLVQCVSTKRDVKFDMYELDQSIKMLDGIDKHRVNYGDFLAAEINKKYKTIIGNPPYFTKFRCA
jgi:16S rRNA A1518/A1519 N6-dimethyltransferase RsmA/KsgA/DIM1 with predicted DNA glycosylase/AP lyase activity